VAQIRDGIPASPGIVIGPVIPLHWEPPRAPHVTVPVDQIEQEIERFAEAREFAKSAILQIKNDTAERLGHIEAQIFEPQILMLDDVEMVQGTISYIRDNHLSAARGFELRMLELQSEWSRSGHPMILDRLNDLLDIQVRVLHRLLGMPEPGFSFENLEERVIIVARDLTPTITVQLDRESILALRPMRERAHPTQRSLHAH
jgi:phosphoenolpyruvate-protein phosphotransferase (PTS system enzyme I)